MTARPPRLLAALLLAHAGVVIALTVLQYSLRSLAGPEDGANIGAGIALLPFIPLGFPWSLPVLVDRFVFPFLPMTHYQWPYPRWTLTVDDLFVMGPAYVNVVLHAVVVFHPGPRRVLRAAWRSSDGAPRAVPVTRGDTGRPGWSSRVGGLAVVPADAAGGAGLALGIASIAVGLTPTVVGLITGPLVGGLGLLLSVVGLRRAQRGQASNRGQARAGLICSAIGLSLTLLGIATRTLTPLYS